MPTSFELTSLLRQELYQSDRIFDDVTARLLEANDGPCEATVRAKAAGVFCGEMVFPALREIFGSALSTQCDLADGAPVTAGEIVGRFEGNGALCLQVERTALNLLSHLSGIATLTRRFVDQTAGTRTKILATRKTLPGLRDLQLRAVVAGGGHIHRRNLSDGILIKDNHLARLRPAEAITLARANRSPLHRVEIEIQSLGELRQILGDLPDIVMLDNFDLPTMAEAIRLIDGQCEIEVSGGIGLDLVKPICQLGVDYISVGRLTHSAPALDLTLDLRWQER
jgi:nicotinate-nucleotide pyrophosphorylase (carboxylating)